MDADRAARAARAWTLNGRRWSLRDIATELGVAPNTVRAYIAEAREAEAWAEVQDRASRQDRMVVFLNELARRGVVALEGRAPGTNGDKDEGQEPQPYHQVVPALMKVVQEINRVEGNYEPIRMDLGNGRREPDRELREALEREAAAAEDADREDARRELE